MLSCKQVISNPLETWPVSEEFECRLGSLPKVHGGQSGGVGVALEEVPDGVLLLPAARADWGRDEADPVLEIPQGGAKAPAQLCQGCPCTPGKGYGD